MSQELRNECEANKRLAEIVLYLSLLGANPFMATTSDTDSYAYTSIDVDVSEHSGPYGPYLVVDTPPTTHEFGLINDSTVITGISDPNHPIIDAVNRAGYTPVEC